jgi:type I restriction enzyme S subunit
MTSDWRRCRLGEFVELHRGFDLPSYRRVEGSVPIVSSAGISGSHSDSKVSAPGVVTGRYGTIGEVFYVDRDFWPLNTTLFVSDFKGADPRFVAYFLRTLDYASISAKSAVPGINRNHLHDFPVVVPDPSEQRRIAGVLRVLDDKIDSNRRLAVLLEEVAATLFRARFVDFVGIDVFEDSPLGQIPKGWTVAPVGDVLTLVGGGTPSTKEPLYWEGGTHCWATPKDFAGMPSPVLLDTARHLTNAGVQRISSRLLPRRTVLMSSRAPIGYTAITAVDVAVNQGFIAFPPSDSVPSEYILFWLRQNMDLIRAHAGGTTFAEISKRAFRPLPMLVPPPALLVEFEQVARPLFDLLAVQEQDIQTLSVIRDELLPKLISGEIRVTDTATSGESGSAIEPVASAAS